MERKYNIFPKVKFFAFIQFYFVSWWSGDVPFFGSFCPQASQMWWNTPLLLRETMPTSFLCFAFWVTLVERGLMQVKFLRIHPKKCAQVWACFPRVNSTNCHRQCCHGTFRGTSDWGFPCCFSDPKLVVPMPLLPVHSKGLQVSWG